MVAAILESVPATRVLVVEARKSFEPEIRTGLTEALFRAGPTTFMINR